jgi:hypothetical protein
VKHVVDLAANTSQSQQGHGLALPLRPPAREYHCTPCRLCAKRIVAGVVSHAALSSSLRSLVLADVSPPLSLFAAALHASVATALQRPW